MSAARELNWADDIRARGPGKYTVKVQAIAKTEAGINDDHKNVVDREVSADDSLYVANVAASNAKDAVTTEAPARVGSIITINDTLPVDGKSTYCMISGETMPIEAVWCNANGYNTGYAIDQMKITGSTVTLTPEDNPLDDEAEEEEAVPTMQVRRLYLQHQVRSICSFP